MDIKKAWARCLELRAEAVAERGRRFTYRPPFPSEREHRLMLKSEAVWKRGLKLELARRFMITPVGRKPVEYQYGLTLKQGEEYRRLVYHKKLTTEEALDAVTASGFLHPVRRGPSTATTRRTGRPKAP